MTPQTVFLVDDHPVLLRGLIAVIAMEPDFNIVGSTTNSGAALKMIDNLKPDIVVLDINMPNLGGIALLRQIRNADLPVRAIFLTAVITPAQAIEAVENGIWGILLKDAEPQLVMNCLRSVAAGQRWLTRKGSAELARQQTLKSPHSELTAREMEIAQYICLGLPNKAIAREIGSSEGTVKVHVHNIFQKMGVTNRTSLAAFFYNKCNVPELLLDPTRPAATGSCSARRLRLPRLAQYFESFPDNIGTDRSTNRKVEVPNLCCQNGDP